MSRWLGPVVALGVLAACGRTPLSLPDEAGEAADATFRWPWRFFDGGAVTVTDAAADSGAPDAGVDPDDLPWLGDTTPFDPAKVDCLDLDAGLACGILTPKQLEAICASSPRGYLRFEAERLSIEGMGTLAADAVTKARVLRDMAELRRRFPALDDASVFVFTIPEAGPYFTPEEYYLARVGAHDGFNCLLTSLGARVTRSSSRGGWIALTWDAELPFHVSQLFLQHTGAYYFGWSSAPHHPCDSDICLAIEGSRFNYVVKTGDCRAPTYETYTVGLDAGVTVTPGWDVDRHPSCAWWFDQVKWR